MQCATQEIVKSVWNNVIYLHSKTMPLYSDSTHETLQALRYCTIRQTNKLLNCIHLCTNFFIKQTT